MADTQDLEAIRLRAALKIANDDRDAEMKEALRGTSPGQDVDKRWQVSRSLLATIALLDAAVAEGAALREALEGLKSAAQPVGNICFNAGQATCTLDDAQREIIRGAGRTLDTNLKRAFAALTSTTLSSDYQERLRKAEAMARTPGTVERCESCGNDLHSRRPDCYGVCPIKTGRAPSTAGSP